LLLPSPLHDSLPSPKVRAGILSQRDKCETSIFPH
jgi:hypothetical protein